MGEWALSGQVRLATRTSSYNLMPPLLILLSSTCILSLLFSFPVKGATLDLIKRKVPESYMLHFHTVLDCIYATLNCVRFLSNGVMASHSPFAVL
jgi:hypothetical protein